MIIKEKLIFRIRGLLNFINKSNKTKHETTKIEKNNFSKNNMA
jgi:hypothetical protein